MSVQGADIGGSRGWTPLYQKHKTSWEHIEEAPIQLKELSNVYCDDNWGERHSLKKERTMRATFKWREEEEGRYIIGGKIEACGATDAQGEDVQAAERWGRPWQSSD